MTPSAAPIAAAPGPPGDVAPGSRRNGRRHLRVCMVHFSNYPVDSRVQRQARALAGRGDDVDCICLSGPQEITEDRGTIRLHNVGVTKRRGNAASYVASYASFFVRAARALTALHRERPFDLVEVHNMPNFLTFAGVTAKRDGVRVVLDVHDTFPELFETKFGISPRHPLARLVRAEEAVSARYADAVMVVTDEAGVRLNERGVGRGRTVTVMNSPDEKVFGGPREPVPVPVDGNIRAIYHGGLADRFGIDPLVAAFALLQDRLPHLSLNVCGADHDTAPLVDSVRRHGAGNVFVEPQPTPFKIIPDVLSGCHLGIVPTARDEFTELLLPVKLLEYVHMGLPVICSRLPVIERYFTEKELRWFEPGSAESLADAVLDVVGDPQAAHERALRASELLRRFSWSSQCDRYLALVDRLVAGRALEVTR